MNGSDPKQIARELLEEAHPALIGLSHWIHANPELGYQEVLASGWVTEWLTTAGFDVRTGVAGMPTAIVGSYGPGPFHIAICAEYDALPVVGHACGHNVIAAAGIGAGLALAAVAEELGLRVTVMGTPAEETGGGKVGLIQAGEFDGVHAAMMVHPWPQDEVTAQIIAIRSLNVTYTGREAHAAGFPYLGVNAADALVVAQTAIALLRQQLRSTDRVHGIVTKGGDAANIIPARTEAQWMVRGVNVARLDEVTALVRRCFEAGALATGTTLEIEEEICYADVRHDPDLARLYQQNAEQLGRVFAAPGLPLSTDMGNVSYVVPTIHPMIGVEANGAVNHQADFAAACATPSADQAIFDGALAMAWTAIDAALDEGLRGRLMEARPAADEVSLVSAAWRMPPLAEAAAVTAVVEDAVAPEEEPAPDPDGATAEADEGGTTDLVAHPVPGGDPDAEPMMAAEPAADAEPATDAWQATAEPTPDPVVADPWAAQEAATDGDPEAVAAIAADEVTVDEVLFVGFEDARPDAAAEVVLLDAIATQDAGGPEEQVVEVWVTPHVLEEWLGDTTPVEATMAADEAASDDAAGDDAIAPEAVPADAPAPIDVWFTTDPAEVLAADAVAETDPAAPEISAEVADPAPEPVSGSVVAPAPTPARQWDRDAWERAFEEAAARVGWEEQFEAALHARMTEEGMDRSEAMADLASDLQEAADSDSADQVDQADQADPKALEGWPPPSAELVSRERIEAEGFSFVAPDLTAHGDELSDVWSRNGMDHASEDMPLR